MKLSQLAFVYVAFLVGKLLITLSVNQVVVSEIIPTFEAPDVDFEEYPGPGECDGFFDAIGCGLSYIGKTVINLVLGVVYVVEIIINAAVFVASWVVLLNSLSIDGMPWWLTVFVSMFFVVPLSIILYRMIRSGDSSD